MDTKTIGLVMRTPLGWVAAAECEGVIKTLTLPSQTQETAVLALRLKADFERESCVLAYLKNDLDSYFSGKQVDFKCYRIDIDGFSPFLRKVLEVAREIPYGEVRTYGWLAKKAGNPKAARAVGQAMARNPIPLLIPGHRVVAANGGLGGCGGGLKLKRALLELEGVRLPKSREGK